MRSLLLKSAVPVAPARGCRVFGPLVAAVLIGLSLGQSGWAQQPQQAKKPEDRTLVTEDKVEIKITYFKSNAGKDAPIIVMLHGKGGNRRQYSKFAQELQNKDFAVITVDLRGHGESTQLKSRELKKNDYQAMVGLDMDAVRDFIFDENQKEQLNMNKLGIVATEFSASVALAYTELDWAKAPYDDSPNPLLATPRGHDVQALVLISPDSSTQGLFASKAANVIRQLPIAIMVGASEKDTKVHDLANSKKLFEQLTTKREKEDLRAYFQQYPDVAYGMKMFLEDAAVRTHVVVFLDKYVKQYTSEWRDRRSRADRE